MREGWFGDSYLILFSQDEALEASRRYGVDQALPGRTIIGLRDWDDFIVRDGSGHTYTVPTVPMVDEYMERIDLPSAASLEPDDRFVGQVKWYVTPLVFGGAPQAGENLTWVSHEAHAQLVAWWNAKYRELRAPG